MAWDHLSVNKPHLVYIILGGFTSLFMLCSSFIKERLYIGEATVATLAGVIFGPHAANLIDPSTWGNVDQITLEFSRIVLVVQCFAVGVELPKYYMEKHWRSVTFLLLPVMTFGWLITSLFIWWMVPTLDWLQSLTVAACVTATDPVLASSVVGKGKFAKRVPRHLRDLLSAESGCNDGMAFPFIYLALYIIEYRSSSRDAAFHWVVITILYECVFGAVYGFIVGYIGRRGIRWAEKHDLVDRESFLVFYFVLALFCAGSGSILGVDDLLVGFAAGVGFSNDGWFTQKTEESHVSNVIDLLLNLAYFVYFGTIIPWDQFNSPDLGTTPWRLVVIALFVIFFRRIPIMMALKPIIPDIKTWREALFAGHFGPIGVGAIFVAILARAELETGSTTPLAELPGPETEDYHLIALIWPIVTFLVIASIIVHGSSIAVFTLGKHINTLTLTMSYTTANEDGPSWMNRLPRIASQSKSMSKMSEGDDEFNADNVPPGMLPPTGIQGAFLRRQKDEDNTSRVASRSSSIIPRRRKKKWDGYGPGGPISQSAITPQRRTTNLSETTSATLTPENSESQSNEDDEKTENELGEIQHDPQMQQIMHHDEGEKINEKHESDTERHPQSAEVYEEGSDIIIENEDGDVLDVEKSHETEKKSSETKAANAAKAENESGGMMYKNLRKKLGVWMHKDEAESAEKSSKAKDSERKRGPALAYQFGNTIIVEDEDGEVVKKYDLPPAKSSRKDSSAKKDIGEKKDESAGDTPEAIIRQGLNRMGTWTGFGGKRDEPVDAAAEGSRKGKKNESADDDDDRRIRFTIGGAGRRMTKEDFLKEIQALDPKARMEVVEESDASPAMKNLARRDASNDIPGSSRLFGAAGPQSASGTKEAALVGAAMAKSQEANLRSESSHSGGSSSDGSEPRPKHRGVISPGLPKPVGSKLTRVESPSDVPETAAERRRREQVLKGVEDESGKAEPRETPAERRRREASGALSAQMSADGSDDAVGETPAEKRRREAALGVGDAAAGEDSDDDNTARVPAATQRRGIRFAEDPIRGRH